MLCRVFRERPTRDRSDLRPTIVVGSRTFFNLTCDRGPGLVKGRLGVVLILD